MSAWPELSKQLSAEQFALEDLTKLPYFLFYSFV